MGGICGSNAKIEKPNLATLKTSEQDAKEAELGKKDHIEDDPSLYEFFFQKLEKEKLGQQKGKSAEKIAEESNKRKSVLEAEKKLKALPINTSLASTKVTTNSVSIPIKSKAHELISKGKLKQLYNHMVENKVGPQEEISAQGHYWNFFHYASHFGASHILEFLVKLTFMEQKAKYVEFINTRTIEGSTPLMIAATYNKADCVDVLLRAGGLDLSVRDKDGRTALHLANNYRAKECVGLLAKHSEKTELQVSEHWMSDFDLKEFIEREFNFVPAVDDDDDTVHKENESKGLSDEVVLKSIKSKDSAVHSTMMKCISSKKNFLDDDFPHAMESITKTKSHEHYDIYKDSRWLRPHQIFKCDYSKIKLFDQIDPNDIRQGSLGVCYFLSVISALAEFPERVRNIFCQTEVNKYGVYGVKFCFQGVPTEIVVDDFLPCLSDKLEPIFSKPNGHELWVQILEKAWAKAFGGYTVVEFEVVDYAMEEILGVPSAGYWMNKLTAEIIWELLKESDSKKYLVSATSAKDVTEEEGLVPTHAYTVLSVHEVGKVQLLKLRNPWGNFEWKGKYGDEADFWKDSKSKALNYKKADDGVFYMDVEEFYSKFSYVSVARYEDNWHYSYAKVKRESNHAAYFQFNLTAKTDAYFRIHQKNERVMLEADPSYKYSPVQFQLFKKGEGEIFNGSNFKYFGRKTILCNEKGLVQLSAGAYVLRAKVHWVTDLKDFVVSCYSNNNVELKEITEKSLKNSARELMLQVYQSIVEKTEEKETFQEGACAFRYKWHNQHCILLFENSLPDLSWKVVMQLNEAEGVRIGKRFRGGSETLSLKVKPKSREVAIIKRKVMHAPVSFSWNMSQEKVKE